VGWAAPQTVALLAAGAALLALFLVIETKVEAPLLPLPLFRLRSVAGSNAVGFLLGTSFLTFVFVGTLYMQQVLGFSALATGAAWMTASVTSLACAGLSQKLVTKTSPKAVMTVGMALIGTGMLWAAQAPPNGSFWADLAGPFFIAGIGTSFSFIPISIGALTGVTERDAGVASGLLNTSQNLGGSIGVAVASSIAASHFRTLVHHGYGTAAALTGGFHLALLVCAATGLAAIPVAHVLIRRTRTGSPPGSERAAVGARAHAHGRGEVPAEVRPCAEPALAGDLLHR
jgi:Major Facilitator Superfamily